MEKDKIERKSQIKGGVILTLFFLLLIISGCTESSYKDCTRDCRKLNIDNYEYIGNCGLFDELNCTKIDWDGIRNYCYNECRTIIVQEMGE